MDDRTSICYHQQEELNRGARKLALLISDFNQVQKQLNESSDLLSGKFKVLAWRIIK